MEAQYDIAVMYEYGNGVTRDIDEAFQWYMRAADNGHPDAKKLVKKYEKKAKKKSPF